MTVGDLLPRLSGVAPTPEAPVTAPAVRDQLVTARSCNSQIEVFGPRGKRT